MAQEIIKATDFKRLLAEGKIQGTGQAPRWSVGKMNKLETTYAAYLDEQKLIGEILGWWYEQVTFLLAPDLRYTPDFMVLSADLKIRFDEIKGPHKFASGMNKVKVAAQLFPFKFQLIEREGLIWQVKEL